MAELYHTEEEPQYIRWDGANYTHFEDQLAALKNSKTIYVGNLSFFTKESQILETFSVAGPVKRVIMGLNSMTKTPCGFCFVEYYHQEHAYNALKYATETVCDERVIRCDADPGFLPGRQFGRGKSGGQIRDERRIDYDPARGRFIPPSILGYHRRGGGHNNNHSRGHNGRGAKRTNSREDYEDNNDRDNYRGSHKRSRGNYEGGYYNRSQDEYGRDRGNYREPRREYRRHEFNEHRYERQRSHDPEDMETAINSSLGTARD